MTAHFNEHEVELLLNTFEYNPETGIFSRKCAGQGTRFAPGEDCGSYTEGWYVRISAFGTSFLAHRLAFVLMGQKMPDMVDHINQNKQDNRWINLRAVTNSQNMINTPARNKTGLKGLYKVGSRWRVQRTRKGKVELLLSTVCLGKALTKQKETHVPL